jgi:DNA invertase Pin-like site-specific DNA recombinase
VSRVGERDERLRSPEFQMSGINGKATAEGVAVKMFPAELDVSGAKRNRAILDQIVGEIEAGELDGIIVYNLSRLSRLKPKERIELVERIEGAGGRILSASESFDASTPEGRFQRELFFNIARMEWEKAAEGFAIAKANAIENDRPIKARIPFGYRQPERGDALVIDEEEAIVVRECYELRADGGSLGDVLAHFERATGRSSYRQTMRDMLANRTYLGELHYGGKSEGSERLAKVGAHGAIVAVELFDAVQAVNEARTSGRGVAVGKARSLLAGIVKCQGCGRGLVETATGSNRARAYKCPNDTRHCEARAHIGAAELNAYVTERVLEWAGTVADVEVEADVELDPAGRRELADRRLAEAEASLLHWSTELEMQDANPDAYAAGLRAREERVAIRRAERAALGQASEIEHARGTLREALTSEEYDTDERRELLSVALAAVVVRKTPRRGAPAVERAEVLFAEPAVSVELASAVTA